MSMMVSIVVDKKCVISVQCVMVIKILQYP